MIKILSKQLFKSRSGIPKKDQLNKVKNQMFIKPVGGLWTSTYDEIYGSDWHQWCLSEDFCLDVDYSYWVLNVKPSANIYVIDCYEDLEQLYEQYPFEDYPALFFLESFKQLDYEAISKDYDGIHLTKRGEAETRFSTPLNLYGYDCECTLFFNWCFSQIEQLDKPNFKNDYEDHIEGV